MKLLAREWQINTKENRENQIRCMVTVKDIYSEEGSFQQHVDASVFPVYIDPTENVEDAVREQLHSNGWLD